MVLKCLECIHKCGLPFNLAFHYSIYHEDKISKCECGDKTLCGICIKELASPMKTDCSFKDESSINCSSSINSSISSSSNSKTKVLTRNCYKCNSVKPLTDFDESEYMCRNCTSAKVNCLYCPSVVRYDGIRAHVKKQYPDVELTRGFSRNLNSRRDITQIGESCSCKYYDFVSFLINNGINIEKVKENINLLKSTDNFK